MKKLTSKESETLVVLAEECSEVAQACSKILRYGFKSSAPSDPAVPNWKRLEHELGDVIAMLEFVLELKCGITVPGLEVAYKAKKEKLKQFSDYLK